MGTNKTLSFDCENVRIKVEEPDEDPIHFQATVAEVEDDISVKVEKTSGPTVHPSMNRKTRMRRSVKMKKDVEDLVENGSVECRSVKMEEELQLIDETETFENLDHPQRSLRQRRPIYNMAEILKELRESNPRKGKASKTRKPATAEQKARSAELRRIKLANETPEQRKKRLERMRQYNRSEEQKALQRERDKRNILRQLATETEEEKLIRLERRRVRRQRYYQKKKAQQASQALEGKFEGSDRVPVTSASGFEFIRVKEEIDERTEGTESAERNGSTDCLVPMEKLYSSHRNQQFESSENSICKEELVIKMEEPWMIEMPESTYRLEQSGAVSTMGRVDEVENESPLEGRNTSSRTSHMMYETVQNVQEYNSPDTCFIKLEKDDEFLEDDFMDPVKMEEEPYLITERQIFQYSEDEEEETRWFDMIRLTACTAQECVAGDHCYAKVESGDDLLLENGSWKRRTVKGRSRKPCPTENSNRSKRKKCLLTAEDESLAVERAMIKMAKNTPAERARRVKRGIERSEILEDYALAQRGQTQERSRLPPTEKDVLLKSERAEWLAKKIEEQNSSKRTGACDELVISSHPIPTADEEALMLQRVKMKIAERLANGLDVDRSVRVEHMRWFRGARIDKKHRRRDESQQPLATETKEEKSKRMREKKMVKREFTRLSELLQQARETEEERAIRLERQKIICSRRRERNKLASWMRYVAKSEDQKLRLRELAERHKLASKDRRASQKRDHKLVSNQRVIIH